MLMVLPAKRLKSKDGEVFWASMASEVCGNWPGEGGALSDHKAACGRGAVGSSGKAVRLRD